MNRFNPNLRDTAWALVWAFAVFCLSVGLNRIVCGETVVLCFTQDGCAPCERQKPIWLEMQRVHRHSQGIEFRAVNLSREKDLAAKFAIARTPTTIFANRVDGKLILLRKLQDLQPRETLSKALTEALDAELDRLVPPKPPLFPSTP